MEIGTLTEKSLHAALKLLYCPDAAYHEVPVAGGLADICVDGVPIEIQTGNLNALKKKLSRYRRADVSPVRVVVPLIRKKRIIRTDPESGECTQRMSPRHGQPWDVLYELSHIANELCDPCLCLTLIEVDVDEYRINDGTPRGKRTDRILTAYGREIPLNCTSDFSVMLPATLPEPFTCADFARATRVRPRRASAGLYVLRTVGAIRGEKDGRKILYYRTNTERLGNESGDIK